MILFKIIAIQQKNNMAEKIYGINQNHLKQKTLIVIRLAVF